MLKRYWNVLATVLFALTIIFSFPPAAGAVQGDVSFLVTSQNYTPAGVILGVQIIFRDPSLYNDKVYFSYHMVSESGETLRYENDRYPISLQADGTADIELSIACGQFPELEGKQTAWIQFDLVDQQNVYWFRDRGLVTEEGAQVLFDRSLLPPAESQQVSPEGIPSQENEEPHVEVVPVVLNVAAWGLLIVCLCLTSRGKAKRRTTNP